MSTLDIKLVEIALEHVTGTDFERFFHAFFPALAGIDFVPLGGTHDGGADAFQDETIFDGQKGRPNTFYQATIQENHRAKIRQTVGRIREFGRDPTTVYYVTARTVPLIDQEEVSLSEELDTNVVIRDRKWIAANINSSNQTVAAFNSFLAPHIAFLSSLGAAPLISASPNIPTRTMCVFLGQEVDRRRGKTDLLEAVTDSLILWALEGTDPDQELLMNRDEILGKIEEALPSARHFIRGAFNTRLEALATKKNTLGREVRWYRKEDKFCLPYETRKIVEADNTEDEFLKIQVMDVYKSRAAQALSANSDVTPDQIAAIAHRSLELTFESEGLELAEFLTGKPDENQYIAIADKVDETIGEVSIAGEAAVEAKTVTLEVLRQAFYRSVEIERLYYGKLSRTYTLMLTLRNEPKVVEYFKGMSSSFVLFVGSDILVRALSERYLPEDDQMTTNMLRILKEAGAELVLTHMAVEEVHGHLEVTDYEFLNWFSEVEPYVTAEMARHANKILIRAYFYAKKDPQVTNKPAGWMSFIEQVCTYKELHNASTSRDQVKRYLIEKFGLNYLDEDDILNLVDEGEVEQLAERILDMKIKEKKELARNDALQIMAIYGRRRELQEEHRPSPYGYRTWWLTHETRVRRATGELVKNKGSQYIIRPEFVLNFIALSPSTVEVQRSFATVFPTLLGVRLSNRMREEIFHDVMKKAKEVKALDEARMSTWMGEMSNKLKGDDFKRYEAEFNGGVLGSN